MNAPVVKKTCPFCLRHFDAHPAAIYCSLPCRQRAKHRRRTQRASYKALSPEDSPNQAEYVNISAEDLARVYADIIVHVFEKDIKLIGTIPRNVPKPADVILQNVPGTNYSIAYHRVRALL